jgi:hypothetical protein
MTKATDPKYSRADIEEALRNLIRKGLVVTKEDEDGRTRYFVNPLASVPESKGRLSLSPRQRRRLAARSVGRSASSAGINREEDS